MGRYRKISKAAPPARKRLAKGLSARAKLIAVLTLTMMVIGSGAIVVAQRAALFGASKMMTVRGAPTTAAISPAAPQASGLSLAKEYVHAGGKVIATEEPPVVNAPSNLRITGFSSSTVSLAWTDNSTNEDGFQIVRDSPHQTFTVAANVTTFTDVGLQSATTFGYEVRAFKSSYLSSAVGVAAATASPPTMTCPNNVTQNTDAGQCSAVVTYATPSVSDSCASVGTPSCNPPSGSTFLKGTTTVNCTVADACGDQASCSFTVAVNDTQAPTLICPANVTAVAPSFGASSAVVTYANAVASDNCTGVGTPSCNPPSGSTFPLGCSTVTCTVTDASANAASCTFQVCVFNICLQDDSNAQNRILINTATGDYRFCCNGTTYTGKGKMTIQGSTYTLEHNTLDRRVRATAMGSSGSGNASLQSPPGTLRCSFSDGNSSNNTTCTTCQ